MVLFISHTKLSIVFTLCTNTDFFSNFISSIGEVFNQLDGAVHHNLKLKGADELDFLKTFDCFIDGYGFVNSDHINFSMKN